MWNHQIDANLIYLLLSTVQGGIDEVNKILCLFQVWKIEGDNEQRYKKRMKEFINHRCCNHNINLLAIFLSEKKFLKNMTAIGCATSYTVNNGLPFVERDKLQFLFMFAAISIIINSKKSKYKLNRRFLFELLLKIFAIFVHQKAIC
ncbi:hypothetical protein RFI_36927 [Reticulomyxa filosa]|uniref:Uncharacterized protein n=1 Tax=Reticulomyxa filosa TaxID=46433 RepID=X6LEU7_RETFI|nr:hypothetical protein RFI_36927 [Reticulomyxa filosa]|eukprot:ETO00513.1 hypothetical protein RFI_36927 [Reticulomyxa filosa]